MRIYFTNSENTADFNTYFKTIYLNTLDKFEEKYEYYQNKKELNKEDIFCKNEVKETIDILKNKEFELYFLKLGHNILDKIRYKTVSEHSNYCVIRAVFDILFKFVIDFEYKLFFLCCNSDDFKLLEFEILRDLRWKIIN